MGSALLFFLICHSERSEESPLCEAHSNIQKTMLKDGEVLEEFFGDKKIIQHVNLYRFNSDSILLSRFARAKYGD